jgi:hypothetical protein
MFKPWKFFLDIAIEPSVLVCCEYSQTVTRAFLDMGCNAYSNDIIPTEGDVSRHLLGDCIDAINSRPWDLIIIHIPCTAMGVCGNGTYGTGKPKNHERIESIAWSLSVWDAAVKNSGRVVMENPASVLFPILREQRGADVQYVQPYEFGHMEQKKTGLALHGLPRLAGTENVYEEMMKLPKKERERTFYMSPGPNRGKERARFFKGFADAMANQWGGERVVHGL